jgi:hypothetical protein
MGIQDNWILAEFEYFRNELAQILAVTALLHQVPSTAETSQIAGLDCIIMPTAERNE